MHKFQIISIEGIFNTNLNLLKNTFHEAVEEYDTRFTFINVKYTFII